MPPRPGGDIRIIANTIWEIISNNANPKKVATIDQRIDLIPAKSNELLKYVRMRDNSGAVGWKEYDVKSLSYTRPIIQHPYGEFGVWIFNSGKSI